MREEWKEYLAEEFNGDMDAMWKRGFSLGRNARTFTDLLNDTDSSMGRYLEVIHGRDAEAMKKDMLGLAK